MTNLIEDLEDLVKNEDHIGLGLLDDLVEVLYIDEDYRDITSSHGHVPLTYVNVSELSERGFYLFPFFHGQNPAPAYSATDYYLTTYPSTSSLSRSSVCR